MPQKDAAEIHDLCWAQTSSGAAVGPASSENATGLWLGVQGIEGPIGLVLERTSFYAEQGGQVPNTIPSHLAANPQRLPSVS